MTDKLNSVLAERKGTHGDFKQQFECAQRIKGVLKDFGYRNVPPIACEALDQICHKLSRIVTGDPGYADHWRDIAGYASLIADMMDKSASQYASKETSPSQLAADMATSNA